MTRSFWLTIAGITASFMFSAQKAQAHEFWLLPEKFILMQGEQMRVDLRNGEGMVGGKLLYLPSDIKRFDIITAQGSTPVSARAGDLPALSAPAPSDGLVVLVHETTISTVTYSDFTKFNSFVTHKAAPEAVNQHTARGLPLTGFTESYLRYAKSLLAVGAGAGADRATGMQMEIVALANPYTDDLAAGLPLRVLRGGAPFANAQIELFAQSANGTVTVSIHQTDSDGVATVPAQSGTTYLADSVDIYALPNDDALAGPVWHSDWASLTYMVP